MYSYKNYHLVKEEIEKKIDVMKEEMKEERKDEWKDEWKGSFPRQWRSLQNLLRRECLKPKRHHW